MSEDAGIGYTNEKQPFLQGQMQEIDARKICIIKTPVTLNGKIDVPYDKWDHGDQKGNE